MTTKIKSGVIGDNVVGITQLNVSDGTNGQVLTTDGSGTLSFSTISGYTDSDVATYLGGGNTINIDTQGTIKLDGNYPVGTGNVALGNAALDDGSLSGGNNTAIGSGALTANTSGSLNVAVGTSALSSNTTAPYNTAIGYQALRDNVSGNQNTAVGYEALASNTALKNTAVGAYAQYQSTSAQESTALGYAALASLTSGSYNVAVGASALDANTTASNNTAVGYASLGANTTGTRNTAVGTYAMQAQTEGYDNTAIGYGAMYNANNAALVVRNTAVGNGALYSTTGNDTTAIGYQALTTQTSGRRNVAAGVSSGYSTTTGTDNTFLGTNAGYSNTTASENVAVGKDACFSSTTGTKLAALGYQAEMNNEYGYDNVSIGYQANSTPSGSGNGVGRITIGTSVTGYGQEWVTFGRTNSLRTRVALGTTTWYSDSDERLKENIQTSSAGLSFINDLRPVTFDWKKKGEIDPSLTAYKEGSEDRIKLENNLNRYGFIAQEVKQAIDNHPEVLDNGEIWQEDEIDGTQGVAPTALIPMLVKAIQELKTELDAAKARITTLEG